MGEAQQFHSPSHSGQEGMRAMAYSTSLVLAPMNERIYCESFQKFGLHLTLTARENLSVSGKVTPLSETHKLGMKRKESL